MSRVSTVKRWPAWVLLVLVVAGFLAYGTTRESGALTPEERVEEITKRLACPVCDGETVYESSNPASAAIRTARSASVRMLMRSARSVSSEATTALKSAALSARGRSASFAAFGRIEITS